MVQELVDLLPRETGALGHFVAIAGTLLGAVLWVLGARFSRMIVTLTGVCIGGSMGMYLPKWFGWDISGAAVAVGAALALGLSGFLLHRLWLGACLGSALACWAALGCWVAFRGGANMVWPVVSPDAQASGFAEYLQAVWQSLPADVARVLPYACAAALVSGLAMSIIWPKLTLALGWSTVGATMLTWMGAAAVEFFRPQWLDYVPPAAWAQWTIVGLMVALGAIIQWQLGPRSVAKAPNKPKAEAEG